MIINNTLRKYINRNFRIRIYGKTPEGKYIDRLVGILGLTTTISEPQIDKLIKKVLKSQEQQIRMKIYKSYTITFYQK